MSKIRLHDSSGDVISAADGRVVQTGEFSAENVERITFGPFDRRIEPRAVSIGSLPSMMLAVAPSVEPGAELAFRPGDLRAVIA